MYTCSAHHPACLCARWQVDEEAKQAEEGGMEAGDLVKAGMAVMANVKELTGARKIFATVVATVQRVQGEFTTAVEELKALDLAALAVI